MSKNVSESFSHHLSEEEIISTSRAKAKLFAQQFAAESTLDVAILQCKSSVPTVPYNKPDIIFKVQHKSRCATETTDDADYWNSTTKWFPVLRNITTQNIRPTDVPIREYTKIIANKDLPMYTDVPYKTELASINKSCKQQLYIFRIADV